MEASYIMGFSLIFLMLVSFYCKWVNDRRWYKNQILCHHKQALEEIDRGISTGINDTSLKEIGYCPATTGTGYCNKYAFWIREIKKGVYKGFYECGTYNKPTPKVNDKFYRYAAILTIEELRRLHIYKTAKDIEIKNYYAQSNNSNK